MTGILKVDQIQNIEDASSVKFNRTTSDGTVLDIQKDGTSVGSVVAESGDLIVGNGNTALRYNDALNAIYPANASTGASLDNTLNLGWSSVRWSNLYMGGNIYLGGTGSANALDDYEEGTWTPVIKSGTNTITYDTPNSSGFTYVKIGKVVHICFYLENATTSGTTGGACTIEGLPFQSSSNFSSFSDRIISYSSGLRFSYTPAFVQIRENSTHMSISYKDYFTDPYGNVTVNQVGSGTYVFCRATYFTDS